MSDTKCPKCGAEKSAWPHAIFGAPTYVCGSFFGGDEEFASLLRIAGSVQSDACKLTALTAERDGLRGELAEAKAEIDRKRTYEVQAKTERNEAQAEATRLAERVRVLAEAIQFVQSHLATGAAFNLACVQKLNVACPLPWQSTAPADVKPVG